MLTPKQRAYLRSIAQTTQPIFQVGKNGITDNLIKDLSDALEARELIKITLLNTIPDNKKEISSEIAKRTFSEVVQIIGNKLTLFKQNEKEPKIILP